MNFGGIAARLQNEFDLQPHIEETTNFNITKE